MERMRIKIAIIIPALAALIAGIIIMITVVGFSSTNTVTGLTNELMKTTVEQHSNELAGLLAKVYSTAAGAASTIAGYLPGGHLRTFDDKRSLAIGILLNILQSNENIVAMWTCWEPNAFDGMDMIWANELFYDDTGRFVPVIYKDINEYKVEALVNYNDLKAGDYYQGALSSGKPHLTNPYTYNFHGEEILLCSIAIPIFQNGKIIGAVGADISIDELFGMVNKSSVLEDGYLFVISSDGRFAAHPDDNFRMKLYSDSWMNTYGSYIENVLNKNYYSFTVKAYIDEIKSRVSFLGTRLTIGDIDNSWMVGLIIPEKTIITSSNILLAVIIAIGLFLVLAVGAIIYTVVHRNLKELPLISSVAERIALGEITSVSAVAGPTKNEIDLLKRSFSKLTNVIEAIMGDLTQISDEYISSGDVDFKIDAAKYSGSYKKIAEGINELIQKHTMAMEQINREKLYDLEKAVETERIASQYKSNFLAKMSHEIRTPMNAIVGMAELLLRRALPEDALHEVQDIKQASSNLVSIINDILDFSKIEAGKMEIIPGKYALLSLVNDTTNIIRMRLKEKPVQFLTNIDGNIPNNLIGDEVRLRQIIINLLSNAAKFTEEGHISMSISQRQSDANCPPDTEKQIWLIITISDTGQGIKPEDKAKLFSDFMQLDTKKNRAIEGTGLGLAISKRLCLAMGGDITVVSEYGKGSEFTATIPQDLDKEAPFSLVGESRISHAVSGQIPAAGFTIPQARILVVDDIATNLKVAEGLLAPYKATVETCLSGAEAIEMIKQHSEQGQDYDLVFMDHMMPEMDGIEATAAVRALNQTVPIIALTANVVTGMKEMFLENGFNDLLAKPIDVSKLDEILGRWIPKEKREKGETGQVTDKKIVLLVDEKPANLRLGISVLEEKYDVTTAPSPEKMLKVLESSNPGLILINANMQLPPDRLGKWADKVVLITEPYEESTLNACVENHFMGENE